MTERFRPIQFTWDGDAMIPHPRFKALCNRQYAVHEQYILTVPEYPSTATRNHYFASLHEVWMNLPSDDKRFPTEDHMRKWLLIKAGFCNERTTVYDTPRDAHKAGVDVRDSAPFDVIIVSGNIVKRYTAKSQTAVAMSKEEFQASKVAVLDLAAELIGTTRTALVKQAKAS